MEESEVLYRAEGGAAQLTIAREGARNALTATVIEGLREGLLRAEADAAVRVVVITGQGEKAFCAGGDLSGMGGEGFLAMHEGRRAYGQLLLEVQSCEKPTIARVNGHALAGGLGLMLACDLAIAVDGAQFGTPEIDVGLFPMMAMALLMRHLGRKRALELVLTGERISATRAEGLGLLNKVVARDRLDEAVAELSRTLALKSSAVLALGKRAFYAAEDLALPNALELLASQLSINALTEDAAEGIGAFLEKRKPSWKDR
jgi:enoyl-CoA hydratase